MKKKIAIVRGPSLSKWEMQIYEPLTKWFEITAIGSKVPVNDIAGIKFPVKPLYCPSQYISFLPKMIPFMFSTFGDTQFLMNFEKSISGFDILHSVELFNGLTLQAIVAKKKGLVKKVTVTVYENIPFLYDEYSQKRNIKKEVITHADHFFAINKASEQMLLLEGVTKEKISIIPQAVDTRIFKPITTLFKKNLREKYGFASSDFIVLCVGRMVWEKGWYDILPAAKSLETYKEIKFLCIGDGPEKENMLKLVKNLRLEQKMKFLSLPYKKMKEVFSLCDVFLYPSLPTPYWNAQFGGAIIEAMSSGLPIITTENGGVLETIGNNGNYVVPVQNFGAISKAIVAFFKKPQLRKKISSNNRAYAIRKYDVKVVSNLIKQKWDEEFNN